MRNRYVRVLVWVVGISLPFSVASADVTSSSVTHNFNAGTANGDLDAVPANHELSDWAVWDVSTVTSNELLAGPASFAAIVPSTTTGGIIPTSPGNWQSWSLLFSNATNGSPSSGSNFGYGVEFDSPFTTGILDLDITPNVPNGSSGTIRVFGETDNGGFFGGMSATNHLSVAIDGTPDADGDQSWTMTTSGEVTDSWMYEFTFENYNGETFNFQISTDFGVQNPRLNIAAVQISIVASAGPTLPDGFSIITGTLDSGGLPELLASDNQYLIMDPTFSMFRYQLVYTVSATAPTDLPSALEFNYESRTLNFVGTVDQTIQLLNYNTGTYETIDTRTTTSTDTVITVTPTGDPTRFVQAGTGAMSARIRYGNSLAFWVFSTVGLYLPYETRVDHIFWQITP